MKVLFIYNPQAGMMQIKNHLFNILNVFSKANYDLTVYPTKRQKEAINYIKDKATNFDLIICSGGDGTLNEIINGLMIVQSDNVPILGYIAAGSTNDYARSLKLPKDMSKAAEFVVDNNEKNYDVGKFNNKYFIYIAAFGAFTKVSYSTPQNIKNYFGHLAYIAEGLKSLPEIKAYHIKADIDGKFIEDDFIYGMITNTLWVGGIYQFDNKKVKLDDGYFEVTLIKEPKDVTQFSEIASYLFGTIKKSDLVLTFKAKEIIIESKEKLAWTIDGEYGGSSNISNIKNIKKAIKIIS